MKSLLLVITHFAAAVCSLSASEVLVGKSNEDMSWSNEPLYIESDVKKGASLEMSLETMNDDSIEAITPAATGYKASPSSFPKYQDEDAGVVSPLSSSPTESSQSQSMNERQTVTGQSFTYNSSAQRLTVEDSVPTFEVTAQSVSDEGDLGVTSNVFTNSNTRLLGEKKSENVESTDEDSIEDNTGSTNASGSQYRASMLPWMPSGIVMSDDTIVAMENLWQSLEMLWKKKTQSSEEELVTPTGIIMKNGDTVPLEKFFSMMDKIISSEKASDAIPKFKAVPAMTRDKDGILVYPDGTPVPLPEKDETDLPVIGWNQIDDERYDVSLLNFKGEVTKIEVTAEEFKDLLEGKNVAIEDKDGLVGAQFAGGYKMYGYPGVFGCPYYSPCSPMYGGMYGHGHRQSQNFYMSASGSSSHGMGYQPYW